MRARTVNARVKVTLTVELEGTYVPARPASLGSSFEPPEAAYLEDIQVIGLYDEDGDGPNMLLRLMALHSRAVQATLGELLAAVDPDLAEEALLGAGAEEEG